MNPHKKLRELGFKKTNFYKPGYDPETYESCMLLDEYESKWEIINGKKVSVKVNKIHPKLLPSIGYLKENVVVCCYRCNSIKNNATYDELYLIVDNLKNVINSRGKIELLK